MNDSYSFSFYIKKIFLCVLFFVLNINSAFSIGDTRHVSKPTVPNSCVVLKASDSNNTNLIQNEINRCANKNEVVELQKTSDKVFHFYSGPLTIPSNGGLLIDNGVVLSAIPDASLYDNGNKTCGTLDNSGGGCKPFISVNNTEYSGIYGLGTIDGQGNAIIKGKNKTWWNLASDAKKQGKSQNVPRLIVISNSKNFTLFNISLKNSPNFHVSTNRVNGFTAWGVKINTPADARNTDGIDPGSSSNVTIAHSYISTGDDNVAIKAGSGATQHVSIINNVFGKGHGMSIGSETLGGVNDILVDKLSMNGTTSGLRIKSDRSKGGLVDKIFYRNVCIKNVQYPFYLDMHYNKNAVGSNIPRFKDIYFNDIKVLTPGKFILNGLSNSIIEVTYNNVNVKKGSIWSKENVFETGKVIENINEKNCPNNL